MGCDKSIEGWPPKIDHTVDFEKDFSVGDLVLVTKPKNGTELWSRHMNWTDGKIMEIGRGNGLHFWKLKNYIGGYSYSFHESWLTPATADQNNAMTRLSAYCQTDNTATDQNASMIQADNVDHDLQGTIEFLQKEVYRLTGIVKEKSKYDHVDFIKMTPMTKMYRK